MHGLVKCWQLQTFISVQPERKLLIESIFYDFGHDFHQGQVYSLKFVVFLRLIRQQEEVITLINLKGQLSYKEKLTNV